MSASNWMVPYMQEIFKLYNLFRLKEIERRGRVRGRQESAAEHVYGCLVLAEYFLPKVQQKLDTLKVLRMLVYHDLAEIEAGDTFILDKEKIKTQKEREADAAKILRDKIPQKFGKDFREFFDEFLEIKTPEAKFCKAIDQIEPVFHSLYDKQAWIINKFTEQNIRARKEKYFEEFPEIKNTFNKILKYMKERGYF